MDFESPDEIERSFNKRQTPSIARKSDNSFEIQPPRKLQKPDEVFIKRDYEYDMDGSESDSESDYELPPNTGSSLDSADSDSEYEEHDTGGFKRLDTDSSKKRLIIKDGRIVKTDKHIKKDRDNDVTPKFKSLISKSPKLGKKTPNSKTSPGSLVSYGGNSFDNSSISPPSPRVRDSLKVTPIDVAAHLKLLGESLTIIGERLKEHEGQIAVSGSLSVLLDSLLCALGPLLCLCQQIPELQENCCSSEQLINTLDNVAFIMPGL